MSILSAPSPLRERLLLESVVGNVRHLLAHLASEEQRNRMCPICRCEYILEPHDEDCAYEETALTVALFDKVAGHIDDPAAAT